MFDLPDAKRVRRSDLFSATSSPHSSRESSPADDPELTAFLRARLDEQLGIAIAPDAQPAQPPAAAAAAENDASEDDELEFRLFARTATATKPPAAAPVSTKSTAQTPSAATPAPAPAPAVQKIRLRSPSLDPDRPAGFIAPSRPESYYFAPALSSAPEKQRAEYADAAVAGEEVLRRASETRWPGCRVPWKVGVVDPVSQKLRSALEGHVGVSAGGGGGGEGVGEKKTKRRKSKKARIALRKKKEQGLQRKVAAERQKVEKEEHERAKRAEKNRKQKLKRREKERAKKAAERGEGGGESEAGKEEDVAMSHS